MKRKSAQLWLKIACVLLILSAPAISQTQLMHWSPAGLTFYGPSPWSPTNIDLNLTGGELVRGTNVVLTGTPTTAAWGGKNWAGGANEDVTFTVSGIAGSSTSYSNLTLSYKRSNTGPNAGTLEYAFGNNTTYTVISNIAFTSTLTGATAITPITLSNIADLQNVPGGTVVNFRIFPTGGTSVGTWYIYGNAGMSINGTVTNPIAYYVTIAQTASVLCNGQSNGELTATVNGATGPYTYSWMPSGGTASVASGLGAGVYTCVVTDINSATTSATYTLTEPATLSIAVTHTDVTCHGGSDGAAMSILSGGSALYVFSWMPGGQAGSSANGLAADNYTLTVTDSHSCTASQTFVISQPAMTMTVASSSSAICSGDTVSVNAGGVDTYSWSNGLISVTPFFPTITATYTVTGTHTLTGCTEVDSLTIIVYPDPTVTALSSSTVACSGSSITLNGGGASSYSWSSGIADGTAFTTTASATYTVIGTDINMCSDTATIDITVNPNPTVTIISSLSSSVACSGTSVTLNGSGAGSFGWSGGILNSTAFTATATSDYTVTGIDSNNCSGTAVITISVSPNPTITAVSSRTLLCRGETVMLTAAGAMVYSWESDAAPVTGTTAAVAISPVVTTNYSVKGTDANGCASRTTLVQEVASCTGFEELKADDDIQLNVFPNPTAGAFTIKSNSDMNVLITNELGETLQLLQLNDRNDQQININTLSTGIYFIRATGNNSSITKKIIITK